MLIDSFKSLWEWDDHWLTKWQSDKNSEIHFIIASNIQLYFVNSFSFLRWYHEISFKIIRSIQAITIWTETRSASDIFLLICDSKRKNLCRRSHCLQNRMIWPSLLFYSARLIWNLCIHDSQDFFESYCWTKFVLKKTKLCQGLWSKHTLNTKQKFAEYSWIFKIFSAIYSKKHKYFTRDLATHSIWCLDYI